MTLALQLLVVALGGGAWTCGGWFALRKAAPLFDVSPRSLVTALAAPFVAAIAWLASHGPIA